MRMMIMEDQLEWDSDNGIANMVGMYIKHADKAFCDYFKSLDNCEKQALKAHNESNEVTPRHRELRNGHMRNCRRLQIL